MKRRGTMLIVRSCRNQRSSAQPSSKHIVPPDEPQFDLTMDVTTQALRLKTRVYQSSTQLSRQNALWGHCLTLHHPIPTRFVLASRRHVFRKPSRDRRHATHAAPTASDAEVQSQATTSPADVQPRLVRSFHFSFTINLQSRISRSPTSLAMR